MANYILGISAFYHDSAACILQDGQLIAAAEEERFSRIKGDASFPQKAIGFCLSSAGITANQLNAVAYYDKPLLTFSRLLQSYLEYPLKSYASFLKSMPGWLHEKLKIPKIIDKNIPGFGGEIYFSRHHDSHAASAFFASSFSEAAIIVVDGVGEWACTSIGEGRQNTINLLKEVRFPHSLGLFYTAMTQYLGFKINFDEYKVMGLAPYGEPIYTKLLLDNLIDLKEDGSLALNLQYFDFVHGLRMFNDKLPKLFGKPARTKNSTLEKFHMDLAASIQAITAETMLRLAYTAKEITGHNKLCMAGGVALNCVANGAIYRKTIFDDIYIQPAAGDAGGAIGAALQVWHQAMGQPRLSYTDSMKGALLGPNIDSKNAKTYLDKLNINYTQIPMHELPNKIANWIAAGHVIGLCQGRMEFGPRALGCRSILGDPRDPQTQTRVNLKVKFRESFRPFAPAILAEKVHEYFDIDIPSPYMLIVMPVKENHRLNQQENRKITGLDKLKILRSDIPAVTHVDYSVRLQTVTAETNPMFYKIISEFYKLTGCPMIVNTSFNVQNEPIICDHKDAYNCFINTDIDILVLENYVVVKTNVDLSLPPRLNESIASVTSTNAIYAK